MKKAVEWYQRAARQGDARAQGNLGVMYHTGKGVMPDLEKAKELYEKAADQGNAQAQSNLGVMYAKGDGVTQDYEKAVQWFQKAADQGFVPAQAALKKLTQKQLIRAPLSSFAFSEYCRADSDVGCAGVYGVFKVVAHAHAELREMAPFCQLCQLIKIAFALTDGRQTHQPHDWQVGGAHGINEGGVASLGCDSRFFASLLPH